ncbi:porin [Pseudogulbenkiania subflava]|uniref:Outer membrane protein (Porin) n=1 Tax=Pseudogulbenkiania subflava DSM 22618 TaxID=1123014 RepID=A0A1Y6BFK8_9NEIS|nr:porin [Pseudogulbenkiania subflava]SME98875.1 Outer membrane protein (porin) [Pseudogulbenkiania subflava DSM 22618]
MKKLLIAAAVAAALPVMAQADTTIYGSIRAGYSSVNNAGTDFKNVSGIDDFGSRMGFKGNEDLGNGLKALWQVENGFAVDGVATSGSGSGTFANRASFIGLSGEFGKIRLGYLDDVLAETEATDNLYGPRRDGSGSNFPLYEGYDLFGTYGDLRVKNSVRYDSPDWHGVNAMLQYGAGEKKVDGKNSGDTVGARLAYRNDIGLFGAYAFMGKRNAVPEKDSKTHRVEFGYDANNLYLAATYQWVDLYGDATALGIADTAANLKNQTWAVNVAYQLGAFKPSFLYSERKDAKVNGNTQDWGAKQWALGLDYNLGKHTLLQASYGVIKEDKGAQTVLGHADDKSSVFTLMAKHNF